MKVLLTGILAGVLIAVMIGHSRADGTAKLPAGINCEMVREKVAEHGRIVAYAWAKLQGYTKREIAEARKCLRS